MANKKVVPSSEDDLEVDSLDAPAGKDDDVILPEATVPLEAEAAGSEDAPVKASEPAAAPPSPPPVFDTQQSCTTVGPSVVIRGKIRSDENLVVFGRIEAGIKSTKDVRIEATGIVNADLDVRCVWVAGIVVGDIHASQLVELAPEARVVGDIHTTRLIVKDGAKFRGKVEMDGLQALEAIRPQPVAAVQPAAKRLPTGKPTPAVAEVIWSDVEDLAPTPAHRPAAVTPQPDPLQSAAARSAQVSVTGGRVGQPAARSVTPAAVPPRTPEKPAAPAPAEKPAETDKGIGSWFRRQ